MLSQARHVRAAVCMLRLVQLPLGLTGVVRGSLAGVAVKPEAAAANTPAVASQVAEGVGLGQDPDVLLLSPVHQDAWALRMAQADGAAQRQSAVRVQAEVARPGQRGVGQAAKPRNVRQNLGPHAERVSAPPQLPVEVAA